MTYIRNVLFVAGCAYLGVVVTACRTPRANLEFSPAMAQTFEVFIEKPADVGNAKQLGEIEGYMASTIQQHFARYGLSARILTNPSEHKPNPNTKLLVIKLVSYTRVGYATTLAIQCTLKEGATVLTSWQDSVQTSRPWVYLVNALNAKIATNLKKYYAPAVPPPGQVPEPTTTPAAPAAPAK